MWERGKMQQDLELSRRTNEKREVKMMNDAMLSQQDLIDNATYDVCCAFLGISDEERDNKFPWDIQILGVVRESITDALLQFGKTVCYPYIEDDGEKITYCSTDECCCEKCMRK